MILIARLQRAQPVLGGGIARHGDRRRLPAEFGVERADLLDQCVAIHPRHAQIGDQYMRPLLEDLRQGRLAALGEHDLRAETSQHIGDQLARAELVIDDQQPQPRQQGRSQGRRWRLRGDGFLGVGWTSWTGKRTTNRAPFPFACAVRLHRSGMKLDQMADDGEPEAQPAMAPADGAVLLAEAIEHHGQEIRGDSLAVVARC